jgi:hypothetical protein
MPRPKPRLNLAAKLASLTVADTPSKFTPIAGVLPYVEPANSAVLPNAVTKRRKKSKNGRKSKTGKKTKSLKSTKKSKKVKKTTKPKAKKSTTA